MSFTNPFDDPVLEAEDANDDDVRSTSQTPSNKYNSKFAKNSGNNATKEGREGELDNDTPEQRPSLIGRVHEDVLKFSRSGSSSSSCKVLEDSKVDKRERDEHGELRRINQYIFLKELGVGATAEVKLCEICRPSVAQGADGSADDDDQPLVAVKVFNKSLLRRGTKKKQFAGRRRQRRSTFAVADDDVLGPSLSPAREPMFGDRASGGGGGGNGEESCGGRRSNASSLERPTVNSALKALEASSEMLKREVEERENAALREVRREIAIMKKLIHPNVVRLVEVIDDSKDDMLYVVMEYVGGGAIMSWDASQGVYVHPATGSTLGPELARSCFVDVMVGLEFLHANHIVHRDLKPENVLFAADGTAKIADFGGAYNFDHLEQQEEDGAESSRDLSVASTTSSLQGGGRKSKSIGSLYKGEGTWAFWAPEIVITERARRGSRSSGGGGGGGGGGGPRKDSTSTSGTNDTSAASSSTNSNSSTSSSSSSSVVQEGGSVAMNGVGEGEGDRGITSRGRSAVRTSETRRGGGGGGGEDVGQGEQSTHGRTPQLPQFDGYQADVWAAGMLLWVFMWGRPPFYSEDPEVLFDNIIGSPVEFPPEVNDAELKVLLAGLLTKDPDARLTLGEALSLKWVSGIVAERGRRDASAPVEVSEVELSNAIINFNQLILIAMIKQRLRVRLHKARANIRERDAIRAQMIKKSMSLDSSAFAHVHQPRGHGIADDDALLDSPDWDSQSAFTEDVQMGSVKVTVNVPGACPPALRKQLDAVPYDAPPYGLRPPKSPTTAVTLTAPTTAETYLDGGSLSLSEVDSVSSDSRRSLGSSIGNGGISGSFGSDGDGGSNDIDHSTSAGGYIGSSSSGGGGGGGGGSFSAFGSMEENDGQPYTSRSAGLPTTYSPPAPPLSRAASQPINQCNPMPRLRLNVKINRTGSVGGRAFGGRAGLGLGPTGVGGGGVGQTIRENEVMGGGTEAVVAAETCKETSEGRGLGGAAGEGGENGDGGGGGSGGDGGRGGGEGGGGEEEEEGGRRKPDEERGESGERGVGELAVAADKSNEVVAAIHAGSSSEGDGDGDDAMLPAAGCCLDVCFIM